MHFIPQGKYKHTGSPTSHLLCSYDFIYCSLLTSGGYGFTRGISLPGQKSGFDHSTSQS